jgi:SAM-dependent methyltransferase
MKKEDVKKVVRESYAKTVISGNSCCGSMSSCCVGTEIAEMVSKGIGYSDDDMKSVPDGANLGLGCGNPVALASIKKGEVVLDLGSGAGFDCFLAAKKVGDSGKVIGVDMTPEMIDRARENAKKGNYASVEFRLGEIENLPVADYSVDLVISNCVVNLSPDKRRVFAEVFRVLKGGGRIMVSDIVLLKPLPKLILDSAVAYVSCIAGAVLKHDYLNIIKEAGFQDISVVGEACFPVDSITSDPAAKSTIEELNITPEKVREVADSIISIKVSAFKHGSNK